MNPVAPSPAVRAVVGVIAVLGYGGIWPAGEMARAQIQPAVTFELPKVCQANLEETVPQPGQAQAHFPSDWLGLERNPLLLPTRPDEVEITEQRAISLEQAVALAYRNTPDLETARLTVERSQAALEEARASLTPTVDLNAGLDGLTNPSQGQSLGNNDGSDDGDDNGDNNSTPSPVGVVTGNIGTSYDILTGGERAARIRSAELQLQQQRLALEQAQQEARSQASLAYYEVQSTRERIRISQAFLTESCRNMRDAILFFDADVGTRFDVLRADVQVAQARQDLVLARSNWRTAQRRLTALLNLPPDTTITTTTVSIDGFWPLTLEESIVLALQNRPELAEDRVQQDIADAQRQIALAPIRPRLEATGSVNAALALTDIAGANIAGFDRNSSAGFGIRVGGRWRVFDGGAAVARAHQAEHDRAIAIAAFGQSRNQVRLEVEESYYDLETNLANIDTARTALEQAREALRLAQRRFDAGVGDQLEVLQAQRALTEAQVRLLEAVLGYNRALTTLERAVSNLAGQARGGTLKR